MSSERALTAFAGFMVLLSVICYSYYLGTPIFCMVHRFCRRKFISAKLYRLLSSNHCTQEIIRF
jgi:hypothetical protein